MKVRAGFVSNSSSSSFIVLWGSEKGVDDSKKECLELLKKEGLFESDEIQREVLRIFPRCFRTLEKKEDLKWRLNSAVNNLLYFYGSMVKDQVELEDRLKTSPQSGKTEIPYLMTEYLHPANLWLLKSHRLILGMGEIREFVVENVSLCDRGYAVIKDSKKLYEIQRRVSNEVVEELMPSLPELPVTVFTVGSDYNGYSGAVLEDVLDDMIRIFQSNWCNGLLFDNH